PSRKCGGYERRWAPGLDFRRTLRPFYGRGVGDTLGKPFALVGPRKRLLRHIWGRGSA
ncbi:unnamed protein product, partial [Scytosiphon promiscuus]